MNLPRRILLTADAVGGVWQYATDLAAALRPHGVEAVIALLGPSPSRHPGLDPGSRCLIDGIEVITTGLPLDWLADSPDQVLAAGEAIAALAREIGADLVHLNSPALAARARFGVPVVAAEHGTAATWWAAVRPGAPLPPALAWQAALIGEGLRAADRTFAPTAAHADAVRRAYKLPFTPRAVHNGRALPAVGDTLPQTSAAFTAGRLWDAAKCTALLDKVAARLPFPFLAAGPIEGPNGERVAPAHLTLTGTLDAAGMAKHLANQPIFVSAAVFEPFGLAVLEAAGAGCPLVLTDIANFRELWDGAALFVPPGDEAGFAAAIAHAAADPAPLAAAARTRAARYLPEATASATLALYAEALAPVREAAA